VSSREEGEAGKGRPAPGDQAAESLIAELSRALEEERTGLQERVKELRCIFATDRALRTADEDWGQALQNVVDAIPPGFQFPELTVARLGIQGRVCTSDRFQETEHRIAASIPPPGPPVEADPGELEVFLLEDPPDPDRLPFIPEEDDLLAAIALRLAEAWRSRIQHERVRLLSTALEAGDSPVVITDREGVVEWVNPAFTRVTRYTLDEAVGRTPGELVGSGEHDGAFYREMWETILDGRVWRGRIVNRRKDGTHYPEEQTITPVQDPSGRITHFVAVSADVTEKARAENVRRRLASMVEATPDLVGLADPEGRPLYINQAGRRLLGLDPDAELADRHVSEFHPPWAAEKLEQEALPIARREGSWAGETAVVGPDGEQVPVWQRILVHRSASGEVDFLSTAARDLREEKRRSKRLQLQGELLEAVRHAVVATDRDGRILYWNRAAEEIYGWTSEEAVGQIARELTVADESRAVAEEVRDGVLRGESWSGELTMKRRDGSVFPGRMDVTPFLDSGKSVVGVTGVSSDETEQRELEARLRQSQKMEAVGRLAGGVAHDFNNLLTVIQGHVQMIMDDLPRGSAMAEDLDQVLKEVKRAASLTRQLLAFSRRQVLIERILDLSRLVAEMEPMLRRFIPERLELEFDVPDEPLLVKADPAQLHQVVLNLAVNATDALPESGRIGFGVETRELSADEVEEIPWHVLPGEYVALIVEDSGSGMTPEVRERIFEPFFTTKPEGEGTGLGLSMVFGIVKQSGGHIVVESEPGEGSRFELLLPRVEGEVEVPEGGVGGLPAGEARGRSGREGGGESDGARVLLVEDETSVRAVTRKALERWGYRVIEARNGGEGLAAAEDADNAIDLVISDIVMPGMGGSELVDLIRERLPGVPVILMSGYSEEELAVGVRHKATAFLEKPFAPEELVQKVRSVLDQG